MNPITIAVQILAIAVTPALMNTRMIQGLFVAARPGQKEWLSEKEKTFFKMRGVALLTMYAAIALVGGLATFIR